MPTRTLQKIQLDYNADVVAWCPVLSDSNIVLCGQYQLVKGKENEPDERIGGISVFRLERTPDGPRLKNTQFLKLPAVFDIKWRTEPINGIPTCAAALTNGTVSILALKNGKLEQVSVYLLSTKHLILSVDWLTWKAQSTSHRIMATLDNGEAWCIQYVPSAEATSPEESVKEVENLIEPAERSFHTAEVWTVAADPFHNGLFYTGGDDSRLQMWQLKERSQSTQCRVVKLGALGGHSSGVCTVQPNPYVPDVVASGSYDENIRVWDMRQARQCLYKIPTGGGVWKLRWRPKGDSIIAAAMRAGCCVVTDVNISQDAPTSSEEPPSLPLVPYVEHGCMAYGIDFCPERPSLIASCSFYDNSLHLWEVD